MQNTTRHNNNIASLRGFLGLALCFLLVPLGFAGSALGQAFDPYAWYYSQSQGAVSTGAGTSTGGVSVGVSGVVPQTVGNVSGVPIMDGFSGGVSASSLSGSGAQIGTPDASASSAGYSGDITAFSGSNLPFRISIDGDTVAESDLPGGGASADDRARTDSALNLMGIDVSYDGLELQRRANVWAHPSVMVGSDVSFTPYWNYGAFVRRAEVLIFRSGDSSRLKPVVRLPVTAGKKVLWRATQSYGKDLSYVLRLYGRGANRYDETEMKPIKVLGGVYGETDLESPQREERVGYGKDALVKRDIVLSGGAVTVSGHSVPQGHSVYVLGQPVPVGADGKFVVQEILPSGSHNLTIAVLDPSRRGVEFQRNLYIPDSDWFYVGLGDLTIAAEDRVGPTDLVGEDGSGVDATARAAFYVKGKVLNQYLVTASVDTGEENVGDLFKNLDKKDTSGLLRRLGSERYYPVYGDSSTTSEDTPTQGKFYVRLERGDSHVMWGNFQTRISGNQFAQITRGLYGAHAQFGSDSFTSFGEHRFHAEGFVAQPGTAHQRVVLRGTGGSLYYVPNQDITTGSQRLRIEMRDQNTGIVLQSKDLVFGQDYTMDYILGRIFLNEALPSTSDDGYLVQQSALPGNPMYLVVNYEYTPAGLEADQAYYGGRLSGWVGEHVKVGVTAMQDKTGTEDKSLQGFDATMRFAPGSYVKIDTASSKGAAAAEQWSSDGGNNFTEIATGGAVDDSARATRIEAAVNLSEIGLGSGKASVYVQSVEQGFAGEGQGTSEDVTNAGANVDFSVGKGTSVRFRYDQSARKTSNTKTRSTNLDFRQKVGGNAQLGVGLGYNASEDSDGKVTDTMDAGIELRYQASEDWEVYGFAQSRILKEQASDPDNTRIGLGSNIQILNRLTVGGEISGELSDDSGSSSNFESVGARISADYAYSDRTNFYVAYELTDVASVSNGSSSGSLTAGGRHRFSDSLSLYGEERVGLEDGKAVSLTHAYGVDLAPNDRWTFGVSAEHGTVEDVADPDNDIARTAIAGRVSYASPSLSVRSQLEGRREKIGGSEDPSTTYLARVNANYKIVDALNLQAGLSTVFSEGNASISDADFFDASVGLAYRPVGGRFAALLKYRNYRDNPKSDSTKIAQRSQIGTVDLSYKLNNYLTLGGKYGVKVGEQNDLSGTSGWEGTNIHLAVVRADFHILKKWDAVIEARSLFDVENDATQTGALAALYYHLSNNFKVGVGYNFSDFSDDLTQTEYDSKSAFVNLVAKF